jgi:hypothetical protein
MAQITRSSVIQKIQDIFGIQSGSDAVPTQTTGFVSPVVEVGPKFTTLFRHTSNTTTGILSIFNTPLDKDFYLTYAGMSITKDVSCDNVLLALNVTMGGISRSILILPSQTLTAGSNYMSQSYSYPLKIDRNTGITLSGSFSVGTLAKYGFIGGFILE